MVDCKVFHFLLENYLSFLKKRTLDLNFTNKLVYEAHIYSFSANQNKWNFIPVNSICSSVIVSLKDQVGFIISGDNSLLLFISEFGYDMTGVNFVDNKFLPCFVSYASSVDLDWSLWAFGGSYYYRECTVGAGEPYAVWDYDWKNFRDPKFLEKFLLIQKKVQGMQGTSMEHLWKFLG